MKTMRFKDLDVGQHFEIQIAGGSWTLAKKIEEKKMLVYRLNPKGRDVEIPIDPELNQDDVVPVL